MNNYKLFIIIHNYKCPLDSRLLIPAMQAL